MVSILCCSTASNVADAGGDDGSDDDEVEASQEQEVGTPDMDIGGEQKTVSHLLGLHPGLPHHHPQLL